MTTNDVFFTIKTSPLMATYNSSSSSLFPSPRLLIGYSSKSGPSDSEAAMSPTSTLETKPFSPAAAGGSNPFSTKPRPWDSGVGIVDALKPDRKTCSSDSRMVLFGSQLKIQIPGHLVPSPAAISPHSPIEFGIKNRTSQLALLSPAPLRSPMGNAVPASPGVFTGCLSASEMELSEEYTCVIARGTKPKTTHIFDNCIVESCGGGYASGVGGDFLNFCCACKKRLKDGKDIFMYRGEKAFCSSECRYQEMLFDEGMEASSDPTMIL